MHSNQEFISRLIRYTRHKSFEKNILSTKVTQVVIDFRYFLLLCGNFMVSRYLLRGDTNRSVSQSFELSN